MILVSNCPALPTNGSPCSSSSAPGASPTNMSCASMLPTPNATFLRDDARCAHLTQASARSRNTAKAAAFSGDERRGAGDGADAVKISDCAAPGDAIGSANSVTVTQLGRQPQDFRLLMTTL